MYQFHLLPPSPWFHASINHTQDVLHWTELASSLIINITLRTLSDKNLLSPFHLATLDSFIRLQSRCHIMEGHPSLPNLVYHLWFELLCSPCFFHHNELHVHLYCITTASFIISFLHYIGSTVRARTLPVTFRIVSSLANLATITSTC